MKNHVAALCAGIFAVGASVVVGSPSAIAEPGCPYDMSTAAGKAEFQQAIVASSQRVGASQSSYGPSGNQAAAVNDINDERNTSNIILACQNVKSTPMAPVELPKDPPLPAAPAAGPPGMDCASMNDSLGSAGPLVPIADRMSGGLLGKIQSAPLAVCGAANSITNMVAPNDFAKNQAVTGWCDAGNSFINPISEVNPCGNTPAG